MRNLIKYALFVSLLFTGLQSQAQRKTFLSKSELGVLFGGTYYVGDLNPVHHFKDSKIALGIVYRYNFHQRTCLRITALTGTWIGYDSESDIAFNRNRNLSFQSRFYELAAGMEVNLFKFRTNNFRYGITPYFYYQLALFHHNPKASYQGELVPLRDLGTEGQGTGLTDKKPYSKIQLGIPVGLGLKFLIAKRLVFSIEYGFRFTFTDYLDDVSGQYVDLDALAAANGPLAAALSDRSLSPVGQNGTNTGLNRGKSETKDFYGVFNAMLTLQLGKDPSCYFNVRKARF